MLSSLYTFVFGDSSPEMNQLFKLIVYLCETLGGFCVIDVMFSNLLFCCLSFSFLLIDDLFSSQKTFNIKVDL